MSKLETQNYRCAYSGALLVLGMNDSIDHILPTSRFPELSKDLGNVEWVTRQINQYKTNMTPDEFMGFLEGIVDYRGSQGKKLDAA